MISWRRFRFSIFAIPFLAAGPLMADTPNGPGGQLLRARIGRVAIPFVSNRGQIDRSVAFYAPTFAGGVYVTKKGQIVYSLHDRESRKISSLPGALHRPTERRWSLVETPVGGRIRVEGEEPALTRVSYFIGNDPNRWRSGIATYETVGLGEVWPGVRVSLRARGNNVEKIFTVAPGAEPSRINIRVSGATSLRVDESGALVAGTGLGEVTFTQPSAYQERDGVRRPVAVGYRVKGRRYGFSVGEHDPTLPVVIDPLLQATYLGGSNLDQCGAIAIQPATGEVFVAGVTNSTDFPGTTGGAQPAFAGNASFDFDTFIAHLNPTLTTLIQATYLGSGDGSVFGFDLAIHPTTGEVFVTGWTDSHDLPGASGGAAGDLGGTSNGFVARFNATLTALNQATYLGGSVADDFGSCFSHAFALAIHPTTGEVFVTGDTGCTDFPGTTGGAQPSINDLIFGDAFVARFNANLTTLNQATYLGASNSDQGAAIAIHPITGEVFVAGSTSSTDFPGTTGGAQAAYGGGKSDRFVARFNAALTTLNQATYLGGSAADDTPLASRALAIHPTTGEVLVAGSTNSIDFPGTTGGAQAAYGGGTSDAYVARFNATLTALKQATYLGGSAADGGSALAIHPTTGEVFVTGDTESTNFPRTTGGAEPACAGSSCSDAFVARLNATLTALKQATYLGGSAADGGAAVAIHPTTGEVFVSGSTDSTDFPATTGGGQPAFAGRGDAFVARVTADLTAFAGTPGTANCEGTTVSALSRQFGTLEAAASALGFPSVRALRDAIRTFCGE